MERKEKRNREKFKATQENREEFNMANKKRVHGSFLYK